MHSLFLPEHLESEIARKIDGIKLEIREATQNDLEEAKRRGLPWMVDRYQRLWSLLG